MDLYLTRRLCLVIKFQVNLDNVIIINSISSRRRFEGKGLSPYPTQLRMKLCCYQISNHVCLKSITFTSDEMARVPGVACMNPSEKGEGLVRAGIILCRKSMYFLLGL